MECSVFIVKRVSRVQNGEKRTTGMASTRTLRRSLVEGTLKSPNISSQHDEEESSLKHLMKE